MPHLNRIKVIIDDVVYELTSHESPEHIQTVANYIDKKIKSIYAVKSEASINPRLKTLFISLNIADDLFAEKAKNEELGNKVNELVDKYGHIDSKVETLMEENKKLKEENETMKLEAEKLRNELEEYMEAFELEEELKRDKKVAKINR